MVPQWVTWVIQVILDDLSILQLARICWHTGCGVSSDLYISLLYKWLMLLARLPI
jgi:hypothetical protein